MASLIQRLARIAASIPEPAPEPEPDSRWFDEAPPVVRRYYEYLAGDFAADPSYDTDRAAAWQAHTSRHPGATTVSRAVVEALDLGYDVLPFVQGCLERSGHHIGDAELALLAAQDDPCRAERVDNGDV